MKKILLIVILLGGIYKVLFGGTVMVISWDSTGKYKTIISALNDSLPDDDIIVINVKKNKKKVKNAVKRITNEMPDVIVLLGDEVLKEAAPEIKAYPVIYALAVRPTDKIAAMKNVKGVPENVPINIQVDYIKKLFPTLKTIGVLFDQKNALQYAKILRTVGDNRGITMDFIGVNSKDGVETAIHLAATDGFILPVYTALFNNKKMLSKLVQQSIDNKVPLYGYSKQHVIDGALFTLLPDYQEHAELVVSFVKGVLSGIDIGQLSVSYGRRAIPFVNMSTVSKVGVKIPANVLKKSLTVN